MKFPEKQLRQIELAEKFNIQNARRLLLSDLIDLDGKKRLKKYLSNFEGDTLQVIYESDDYGRLSAKVKDAKPNYTCMTQCNMWNQMKAVGCRGIYSDIDIANCHPVLLQQLFKGKGYSTKYLERYIKDRQQLCKDMGITKDNIKKLMYGLMYNPKCFNSDKWQIECKVKTLPELFTKLEKEMKTNALKILEAEQIFFAWAKTKNHVEYWNLEGSALSYMAQHIEKTCLLSMYDFMVDKRYEVGALIHDGMHVLGSVSDTMLKQCSDAVFKDTGFRVKIVVKEFEDFESQLDAIKIVENDKQAGDIIRKEMTPKCNDMVVSQGRTYFRQDNIYILDDSKNLDLIKTPLMNLINEYTIFNEFNKSLTQNMAPAKNILEYVLNHARIDSNFAVDMFKSSIGRLCYKNGYYDFASRTFNEYDGTIMTTVRIEHDFVPDMIPARPRSQQAQKDIDEMYKRVLDPTFSHDHEIRDYYLKVMARALAGHIDEDRQWLAFLGPRSCGKGVQTNLFENCFGDYIGMTNANNFLLKKNQSDEIKILCWMVGLDLKRICFTNEIKKDSKNELKIDGAMMKTISSGGDKLQARGNHKDPIIFKLQTTFVMMMNDMPTIEPADATENCVEFHLKTKFVD